MNRLSKNPTLKVFSVTVFVLALTLAAALALKIILWDSPVRPFLSGLLISLLVLFVATRQPFSGYLAGLPKIYALIFSLCLFLFVGAHLVSKSRATFPFVSWAMFTNVVHDETVQYHQYLATTERGEQFLMRPSRVVRTLHDGRFINRLEQLSRGLSLSNPPSVPQQTYKQGDPIYKKWLDDLRLFFYDPTQREVRYSPDELKNLLGSFLKIYNLRHADDPIKKINVIRVNEYFLEPHPWKVKREVVFEVFGEKEVPA